MLPPLTPPPSSHYKSDLPPTPKRAATALAPKSAAAEATKSLHQRSIKSLNFIRPDSPPIEKLPLEQTAEQRIALLTKSISKTKDAEAIKTYKMERARQCLLTNKETEMTRALTDIATLESRPSTELYYLKAETLWLLNDWEKAQEAFEMALKLTQKSREEALKGLPEDAAAFEKMFRDFNAFKKSNQDVSRLSFIHQSLIFECYYRAYDAGISAVNIQNMITNLKKFLELRPKIKEPQIVREIINLLERGINEVSLQHVVELFNLLTIIYNESEKVCEKAEKTLCDLIHKTKNVEKDLSGFGESLKLIHHAITFFPEQVPRLLILLKENPNFLLSLTKLHSKLGDDAFSYLLSHYIKDLQSVSSNLTKEFIEKVLQTPKRIDQFKELLQIEQKRNTPLLHLFLIDPARLDSLLKYLVVNEEFSRQLNFDAQYQDENWTQSLILHLEKHEKRVFELFSVAGYYPSVLKHFWNEESIWDPHVKPTPIAELYQYITTHNITNDVKVMLFKMVDIGEAELALKIVKSPTDFKNLLEVASCGENSLVQELLVKNPNDPLIARLLIQLNTSTISVVRTLLKLHKNAIPMKAQHPLVQIAAKKAVQEPFSNLFRNLLVLHVQGNKIVLNKAIAILEKTEDDKFLTWISEGRLALASDSVFHVNDFWKDLMNAPLNGQQSQQMRDLHNVLQQLQNPPVNLSNSKVAAIEEYGRKLLIDKSSEADSWFAAMLFQMNHNPESIKKSYKETDVRDALVAKLNQAKDASTLTLAIADCLITAVGTINKDLIPELLPILRTRFDQLKITDEQRQFIEFVLKNIQMDQTFSDSFEKLKKVPDPKSIQSRLIRSFLKIDPKKEVTLHDARKVILSALFTSETQYGGSCFGTAMVRQLNTTKDGLKQVLEDYLNIVSHGFITRIDRLKTQPVDRDYAIYFNENAFKTNFPNDNYLARAREYTIASLGGARSNLAKDLTQKSWKCIWNQIALFKANLKNEADKKSFALLEKKLNEILTLMQDAFRYHCVLRYLGHVKSKKLNIDGGWVAVNRSIPGGEDEEPMIASREAFERPFLNTLSTFCKKKMNTFSLEERALMPSLFESFLPNYVLSDQFVIDLLGIIPEKVANFFRFDPKNMDTTLLTNFEGGHLKTITEAYHQTYDPAIGKNFPTSQTGNELDRVLQYIQNLTTRKMEAGANPLLLKSCIVPRHAMNLRIGQLEKMLQAENDIKKIIENMRKANAEFMNTPLTPQAQYELLREFYKECNLSYRHKLKENMRAFLAKNKVNTVGELCRHFMRISVLTHPEIEMESATKIAILRALHNVEGLKKQIPQMIHVGDTNHTKIPNISFGLDLDENCGLALYTDSNGVPVETDDLPDPVSKWVTVDFSPGVDDLDRRLFKP